MAISVEDLKNSMSPQAGRELERRLQEKKVINSPDDVDELEIADDGPVPWYVRVMRFCTYTMAYFLLGLGWTVKKIGEGIFWFGQEMKQAARNID